MCRFGHRQCQTDGGKWDGGRTEGHAAAATPPTAQSVHEGIQLPIQGTNSETADRLRERAPKEERALSEVGKAMPKMKDGRRGAIREKRDTKNGKPTLIGAKSRSRLSGGALAKLGYCFGLDTREATTLSDSVSRENIFPSQFLLPPPPNCL